MISDKIAKNSEIDGYLRHAHIKLETERKQTIKFL